MSAPGNVRKTMVDKSNWQTPPELFKYLNDIWHFTVDGAADAENALCSTYYSIDDVDAFSASPNGESIWVNPPYGKLEPWIDLFCDWGKENMVVALVPAATDTVWWNRAARDCSEVVLLGPGRVHFIDPETSKPCNQNTTSSSLLVWVHWISMKGNLTLWDWRKDVFGGQH